MSLHPDTDLRVVYRVEDVDPRELDRLRRARGQVTRPSLTQIAAACRTYYRGGPVDQLREVLRMAENPPEN